MEKRSNRHKDFNFFAESTHMQLELQNENKTILVVEDDHLLLEFVHELLNSQGYQVLLAGNSQEALGFLENQVQPIDLIFSDIRMPGGMDGVRLVRQAKTIRPDLKVLLTTGFSQEMLEEPVHHEFRVIQKPYRPFELASVIDSCLCSS